MSTPSLDTLPGAHSHSEGPNLGEDPGPVDGPLHLPRDPWPCLWGCPESLCWGQPGWAQTGCLPPTGDPPGALEAAPHHSWANPTGMSVTLRDTFRGREQAARLPEIDINDPFGSSSDSWRQPAGQCPPAARLPGKAAVTGSALAAPSGLQGEEKEAPGCTFQGPTACSVPPHTRLQLWGPCGQQRAQVTVLSYVFKRQCATASGHSASTWRRVP